MAESSKGNSPVHASDENLEKWGKCSRRHFSKLTMTALGALAIDGAPAFAKVSGPLQQSSALQPMRYGIGPCWHRDLGDIRALISVPNVAGPVRVRIPWRRRDTDPQDKQIILQEIESGKRIENVVAIEVNRDFGEIVFQPSVIPGSYALYYMPYTVNPTPWEYSVSYLPSHSSADTAWLAHYGLAADSMNSDRLIALPRATVTEIQARTDFDSYNPMEIIATEEEKRKLLMKHPGQAWLLFPERREFPIRMTDDLPLRWTERGPTGEFYGQCRPNEFYVFQVGVYAFAKNIQNLEVGYEDLISSDGAVIGHQAMRCFNLGGVGWNGRPIEKVFGISKGKVGALWFGVQIPGNAVPGKYHGTLTLRAKGVNQTRVNVILEVSGQSLESSGDNDIWRLSRLRWLDSTIAIDDGITPPYTPLRLQEQEISCLGRELRFDRMGLPESIHSNGREILAGPVGFVVVTGEGNVSWETGKPRIVSDSPGAITWESLAMAPELQLRCIATMEFDGYVNFNVSVRPLKRLDVKDLRLEIPLLLETSVYMMGLGRKGGYRPTHWEWKWDIGRANNSLWIGDFNAGLQLNLKGPEETWDIYDLRASGIPDSWGNDGKGGCTVATAGNVVTVSAYSGPRPLDPNQELEFRFGLLITPVKPLDTVHWKQRYYQQSYPEPGAVPTETLIESGVTIVNIHQGNELNPWINYPFLTVDKLSAYIDEVHATDIQAKIYYTVRELSNHVVELWALRSLNHEVFTDGPGGGGAWLREHLVSNYKPAWHTTLPSGEVDQAITETGLSRWDNYYLEGLAYLLKRAQIDGLYLDGIGYNRQVMKRVRKVLDRNRPGSLIDLHSGNTYTFHDYRISPANQYMGHFPYINSLWFGEGYNYNESPDYWLVEVSGIPFGLFSDMLQGGGNPWRGMVYGMTARCYQGVNPTPIWRFWDDFGIQDAEMVGYWVPSCPIRTSRSDILATVYKKREKVLIAVASWSPQHVTCHLSIDWSALKIKPEAATLSAARIEGFQEKAVFSVSSEIPFQPGRGWLLILENAAS